MEKNKNSNLPSFINAIGLLNWVTIGLLKKNTHIKKFGLVNSTRIIGQLGLYYSRQLMCPLVVVDVRCMFPGCVSVWLGLWSCPNPFGPNRDSSSSLYLNLFCFSCHLINFHKILSSIILESFEHLKFEP